MFGFRQLLTARDGKIDQVLGNTILAEFAEGSGKEFPPRQSRKGP